MPRPVTRRPAARDTPVPIEVENHNWSDMVIFLDRGNLSQRLGTVTSQTTTVFTVSYFQLGTTGGARLRADPIGALRNFSSETINLQPGQTIKWTIENDIDRSFLGYYNERGTGTEAGKVKRKRKGITTSPFPFPLSLFLFPLSPFPFPFPPHAARSIHPTEFGLFSSSNGSGRFTSGPYTPPLW